ncbi:uncharacterized protein LOC135086462 [Ostrinia nubilalis]|uniref:uncharacterized protein LOC135086462 n=1 Tax=Ostrinia nubilalis TaxID=29057 RepID=UPI00308265FD
MSAGRRKMSFLAFSTQDPEDRILLDEEMDRVWRDPTPGPSFLPALRPSGEPLRDIAAPRPIRGPGVSTSASDLSPFDVPDNDLLEQTQPLMGSSTSWGSHTDWDRGQRPPPREDSHLFFIQNITCLYRWGVPPLKDPTQTRTGDSMGSSTSWGSHTHLDRGQRPPPREDSRRTVQFGRDKGSDGDDAEAREFRRSQ